MEIRNDEMKGPPVGISSTRKYWYLALAGLLIVVIGCIGIEVRLKLQDPSRATKPFRIGYQQSPPFQYAAGKTPAGPAIEIVAEAARRRNIPIEWVFAPDGPEPNLRSGKVDLWPLLGDIPERRKFLYISDPWTRISFWLVSSKSSGISTPQDTVGHSLAYTGVNIGTRLAQRNFPGAHFMPQPNNPAVMEAVCTGKVDAAMIGGSKADGAAIQNIPACRNVQLNFYPLQEGMMNYGIGASFNRPEARGAADAIREEIGTMSRDGAVSAIYFRYFNDPGNDTTTTYYLTEAQQRNVYLIMGICALTVLLGLFGWQTFRVRMARRAAEHLNMELKEASLTDPLTRLHNRRFFNAVIEAEINKALRQYSERPAGTTGKLHNRDLVFYLVDIDHFKSVNDIHGHHIGDAMLVEAAQRIGLAIRKSDTLIRWGGEEFLVISYSTERDKAEVLAQRIMEEFSSRPFDLGDSIEIYKTCSIGWAPFPWFVDESTALDYEEVLKLADRALYMAKESGRNCAVGSFPASNIPLYRQSEGEELPETREERVPVRILRTAGPVQQGQSRETDHDGEPVPADEADAEVVESSANSRAAKQDRKNRVVYHTPPLGIPTRERMSLENQLRGAAGRGEICVHYQPEFDLTTNQLSRFEALVRWNHPKLGMISPAKFIPIAEESGMIVTLGAYIMEQACREAVKWQKLAFQPIQVAVNVSSFQFVRDTFVDEVLDVLQRTGLDPELLQLEVTESAMICGLKRSAETIKRLHAFGITLAIDDFGTGYSCLSYLPHLRFDVLKIDRSFVKEMNIAPAMEMLVHSLISMAHNFNMRVIAEGIESLEQMQKIRELGADEVQGYLLGRPMANPESQIPLLLQHDCHRSEEHAANEQVLSSLPLCVV